jgi:N-acetylmuramoyl-L-alanine amidase
MRIVWAIIIGVLAVSRAGAEEFRAVARVDAALSTIEMRGDALDLTLALDVAVPYRVFTLSAPDRMVVDFREVDWRGVPFDVFGPDVAARFGVFKPGWSRMVVDLPATMAPSRVEMDIRGRGAVLSVGLKASASPSKRNDDWTYDAARGALSGDGAMVVAIDPGHGGIDPGAVRAGVAEKDIALAFAQELRGLILESGAYSVVLTRESDVFVSLRDRIRVAQEAGADVFISLHANTVTQGNARGATIYSLSERASDAASEQLAALENRADIAAGLDLQIEADDVARTLLDMARTETNPRSRRFADALVRSMDETVGVIRSRPHRSAGFLVLKAPDIPSLMLELGFMSNATDRANMQSPEWRARAAAGVLTALHQWAAEDRVLSQMLMK